MDRVGSLVRWSQSLGIFWIMDRIDKMGADENQLMVISVTRSSSYCAFCNLVHPVNPVNVHPEPL